MNSSNAPLFAKNSEKESTERPQAVRLQGLNSSADNDQTTAYTSSAVLLETTTTVASESTILPDVFTDAMQPIHNEDKSPSTTALSVQDAMESSAMSPDTDTTFPTRVAPEPAVPATTSERDAAVNPTDQADNTIIPTAESTLMPPELNSEQPAQPGAHLKYLREQKGISVQYVADHLYLGMNVIETLEMDDYDSLPSPIFVRGYLNNYARLLEVDAEPILAAYKEATAATSPPPLTQVKQKIQPASTYKPTQKRNRVPTNNGHHHDTAWLPFLIIGVLIGLASLGLFWLIYPQSGDLLVGGTNVSLGMNNDDPTLSEGTTHEALLNPHGTPIALSESIGLQNENDTIEYAYTPPIEENLNDEPTEQPLSLQSPDNTAMSLADNAVVPPPSATEANTDNTPPEVVTQSPNQLKINYTSAASWTRVLDATGEKLFEGTKQAGDSLVLQGQPPFRLRFGVMQGVQVEYQNEILSVANSPLRQGNNLVIGE